MHANAQGVDLSPQERPENLRRRFARRDITEKFGDQFDRQQRMAEQNAGKPVRRCAGIVVHERQAPDLPQHLPEQ